MTNIHRHIPASSFALTICELGLKNQRLISKNLDLGLFRQACELRQIDEQLRELFYKTANFDFVGQIAKGKTLLVGEGNLSFSLSLARKRSVSAGNLTATTYEKETALSDSAIENAETLRLLGVQVLHNIDATKINSSFEGKQFESIVFQFPHTGSREPIYGRNPNFILVRNFLRSAADLLSPNGLVLITAVDTPHYQGAFQFEDAAKFAGFQSPVSYLFDADDFPGYEHIMTNEDTGALNHHDEFRTWVFQRQ